jgi:hypothetical protein
MAKKEISDEKLLDMIRSILPSTARVAARREKAEVKRRTRRRVRAALHNEDAEETKFDFRETADTYHVARWRQGADKLNHFMRWCESWTNGMTERQKLDAVRAVLPRNLIGDHAFSHWEQHLKYRGRYGYLRDKYERERQSRYDKTRHRLRRALSADPGLQGRLNAAIKERKEPDEPRRLLLGVHDIGAFVRHVLDHCTKEERVLLGLLEEAERYTLVIPSVERGTWAGGARRTCLLPRPPRSLATLGMTQLYPFSAAIFCRIAPM